MDRWDKLLGRKDADRDFRVLASENAGRNVLVTGAGGCIGSALAKAILAAEPKKLILLDHSEQNLYEVDSELAASDADSRRVAIRGDVTDEELLREVFESYGPEMVYHAAAFKHVPLMEQNPVAALRNNAIGTWKLAKAAAEQGIGRVLMISTDKAANPRSVMGAAKRVAELVLASASSRQSRMSAIRLGNVLGSHGSVGPLFVQQIERGGPVTVTDAKARRYFLTLAETVELILRAAWLGEGGDIFVPEMGEPIPIAELARRMIEMESNATGQKARIEFTGLRPGDKMSEDIVSSRESLQPMDDGKLYRVAGSEIDARLLESEITKLSKAVDERNAAAAVEAACKLVPEYQPSEALLSLLDRSLV